MWSRSIRPRGRPSLVSRRPYSRGRSLPLRPPQAIVGPRPQLKERVGMARPRSAVYAVEGESRRPGIHLDWVTTATTCTRPSCGAHSGTRRSGREVSPSAPAPYPPPLVRDASPRGRPRHPNAPGAAGAPRRQHTMIYTHVGTAGPPPVRSTADRMFGP